MALVLTLRGAPGRFCQGSPWFPGSPPLFPWAECHILQHDPACTHQHRDTEPLASWWDQFSFTHEYQVSLIFMLSWKYPSTYCGWGPIKYLYSCYRGFPGGASGKEPACQCRRHKRHWVQKMPWRRARQSTPVFLPGESHGQRSLAGYIGLEKSQTRLRQLSTDVCTHITILPRNTCKNSWRCNRNHSINCFFPA